MPRVGIPRLPLRPALLVGPALFACTVLLTAPGGLSEAAWRVAGTAAWMATWWLTGVVALEVTALLPLVVLPLAGIAPLSDVTRPYADPVIFLFMGGFFLAATLERWHLHRRFALGTVRAVGTDARMVVLAFLVATAVISMWMSNTATAVMMLPIAAAVVAGRGERPSGTDTQGSDDGFPPALLLAVAYGASIGGVGTLIGTPPNAIFAAQARQLIGASVDFADWLVIGLPTAAVMLLLCWLLLVRTFRVRGPVPGLAERVDQEHRALGRLSGGERFVLTVFVLTALAWVLREPKLLGAVRVPGISDLVPGLTDTHIAIIAALTLFVVPLPRARFSTALDWETARHIPWGVLLLFGGGLALAGAFEASGLTEWIGGRLGALRGLPYPVVIAVTAVLFVVLTELTSNTATAALGMPLVVGVAEGLGQPALPLMATVALSSSMAFMLPVSTPPNAIVYGSGAVTRRDMLRAGVRLCLCSVTVVTLVMSLWSLGRGP